MIKLTCLTLLCFLFSYCSLSQNVSIEWSKSLGGSKKDEGKCIQPTKDGGFVLIGSTSSNNGNIISGNHGGPDVWVVKLNSAGSFEWQHCFGGTKLDEGIYIEQTKDNGYIFIANSWSNDFDVKGNHVNHYLEKSHYIFPDIWVVKLSEKGIIQWQKCLGGINYDISDVIHQTKDGGYILLGSTQSIDGDVKGQHDTRVNADKEGWDRNQDAWVVKLTPNGSIQWSQCLGNFGPDGATSIIQTTDEGYITILNESLLTKLTKNGLIEWQRDLDNKNGNEFQQTPDSGYLIISDYMEGTNFHIVVTKLLQNGTLQWEKRLGGSGSEIEGSMQLTEEGGCIIIGTTTSNDGDINGHYEPIGYNNGRWNKDIWIVELSNSGSIKWQKCFGGTDVDNGIFISKIRNGEYIIMGNTLSNNNDIKGYHVPISVYADHDYNYDIWIAKIKVK